MITLNNIVRDGILEICFLIKDHEDFIYTISDANGLAILQGRLVGNTQRTCLYLGDIKKGNYTFTMTDDFSQEFSVK